MKNKKGAELMTRSTTGESVEKPQPPLAKTNTSSLFFRLLSMVASRLFMKLFFEAVVVVETDDVIKNELGRPSSDKVSYMDEEFFVSSPFSFPANLERGIKG